MVGGSTEPQFGHFGPSWPLSICRPPMEPSVAPGPTQTTLKSPVEGHSTCKVDDDITVDQLVDRGFRDVMRHERAYHRRVRNLRPTLGKKKVSKVKRVEIDVLMSAKLVCLHRHCHPFVPIGWGGTAPSGMVDKTLPSATGFSG